MTGRQDVKMKVPRWRLRFRLLLYFAALLCSVLSVTETAQSRLGDRTDIAVYVAAACGLLLSGYYLRYDLTVGFKDAFRTVIERYALANRICQDYRYRTVLATTLSFLVNIIYAFSNGVYGWFRHSPWLGTLAAYYLCLSVMRFGIVRYSWKGAEGQGRPTQKMMQKEWRIYRRTGLLLLLITIVLGGTVVLLVHDEGGTSYPGTLILAVAAYTFYKIILSAVHMVKARRLQSPLLVAVRSIGYADAMVSLLSLQTAMFVSFGDSGDLDPKWMNGMTGAAVCAIISLIGIYMILSAGRKASRKFSLTKK